MPSVSEVNQKMRTLGEQMGRVILGQDRVKEQILVCLLAHRYRLRSDR